MEHYDVIIIGTGAGGGTLAHRLAPSGKRILLLERGGYLPRELENWDSEAVFGQERYVTPERWYDKHGVAFRPHAQYFVGGNTKVYGGYTVRELAGTAGVMRLGVETVPQIVTRGWLVDVPGLGAGGVITPEHCGGIDPEPGDAVLFHTGWSRHWSDPDIYLSGEPGPGCELAQWLADRRVALTGCDTWSYGPVPPEDPDRPFRVPQILNIDHGVFVVENLNLAELAADGVRRFALILTHPKPRGATGAWTSPIALI